MSERTLLMIPGPVELEPDVYLAMAEKTSSHLDPRFVRTFGRALTRLREVFFAPKSQPFVIAGSGTLAMEMSVMNLVERGDRAVVVHTGWFSSRIADMLRRLDADVVEVRAPVGDVPSLDAVEKALAGGAKVLTITHVDTSTGVLADVQGYAKLARDAGALTIVDAVCSAGAEEIRHDEWGLDVTFTASQKALGAPPGLAVLMVSERALETHANRKSKITSMYGDFASWLPVHRSYEAGEPGYFATPPVNLLNALDASLSHLLSEHMDARFRRHRRVAHSFRAALHALGLRTVPARAGITAHTLSAPYYPDGVDASLLGKVREEGAIIAGGLHPDIKTKYFRVGHMGVTGANDTLAVVGCVARALKRAGYACDPPSAVAAAEGAWLVEHA